MKKTINFLALVMLMIAVAIPAGAKSPKATETAVFTVVPQMTCQNCENKIKSNLRFENGVSNIATSLADQTVTVTFDPAKTDSEQLIAAFQKIGYTATCGKAAVAPAGKCGDCKGHDGACTKPLDQQCADCKAKTQAAQQSACPKAAAGSCKKSQQGSCAKAQLGCPKATAGTCPKAAAGSCKKSQQGSCAKAQQGCPKATAGTCPKAAAGSCKKSQQGSCAKAQQRCPKATAGTCPKTAKAACAKDSTANAAHCGGCKH